MQWIIKVRKNLCTRIHNNREHTHAGASHTQLRGHNALSDHVTRAFDLTMLVHFAAVDAKTPNFKPLYA